MSPNKFLTMVRYHFLTSKSISHFRITRVDQVVLDNISELQSVVFQNDELFLSFLEQNRHLFEELGLLADSKMCHVNANTYVTNLRAEAMNQNSDFDYKSVLANAVEEINRAKWENARLELFSMLKGLKYYFPAFVDFRGRIYRTGLISPHERVMIRALSCFAWEKVCSPEEHEKCRRVLILYLGHQIKRCHTHEEAIQEALLFQDSNGVFDTVQLLKKARNQYLAVRAALWLNSGMDLHSSPISCDASSSAYPF